MELRHIAIENIHDTKLNMRHDRRPPDVSDILPTVKAKGILQPLLVRPYADGGDDAVEIVAGRRRYWCGRAIVDEQGSFAPLPCAVMEAGDDASAIEASLIENAARRDADPWSRDDAPGHLSMAGFVIPLAEPDMRVSLHPALHARR